MSAATLVSIERVEIVGLKCNDSAENLGPRTLVTGEVGSGKSRISDALRFAALGYVPAQGKREADTARLMRGALMRVTVTLSDGRSFWRQLRRKGPGFTSEAGASWMDVDAKPSEVSEAIRSLFGSSDLEAEECLDLRALLAASPNERAKRIEALLDATAMTPADQVSLLYALPVFKLAKMDASRIPAAPAEAEKAAAALAQTTTLTAAERGALAAANAIVQKTLLARGAAEALVEAGRMKNQERERVRGKQQARKEIEDRSGPAPAVTLDVLSRQRQARTDRLAELRAQVKAHEDVRAAREQAEQAAQAALEALDAVLAAGDPTARAAALKAEAEALRAKAGALVEPAPVPAPVLAEEDAALIEQAMQLEEDARALDEQADGQRTEPPAAPRLAKAPAVDTSAVTLAEKALEQAKANPWQAVRSNAEQVRSLAVPAEQQVLRDAVAADLDALADKHGGLSVRQAAKAMNIASGRLMAARDEAAKVEGDNAMARTAYEDALRAWNEAQAAVRDLRARAVTMREQASAIRVTQRAAVTKANDGLKAAYRRACGDRAVAADRVAQERRALTAQAEAKATEATDLLREWTGKAAALAEARARLDGLAVAAPLDLDAASRETADLEAQVSSIDEQRRVVQAADARKRELSALAAELDSAMAAGEAWTAIEWALQRIRERDLADRSGPLVERMHAFLKAAGRPEVPFLRAAKGKVDFGWRRGADEIAVEALSGGETVLATTALAGAILALRAPDVRVLLIEAAELGLHHAASLMAGCEALAGEVGSTLVATCLPIEPRDGWKHIEVAVAQAATAGAAA